MFASAYVVMDIHPSSCVYWYKSFVHCRFSIAMEVSLLWCLVVMDVLSIYLVAVSWTFDPFSCLCCQGIFDHDHASVAIEVLSIIVPVLSGNFRPRSCFCRHGRVVHYITYVAMEVSSTLIPLFYASTDMDNLIFRPFSCLLWHVPFSF